MNVKAIVLGVACLVPCALVAQNTIRDQVYFGAMGGVATLSGDASAVITPTAASTSSYDPSNGAAASVFAGTHIRNYVSLQADYVWNRNDVVLTSSVNGPGGSSFYHLPESVVQNAFLGNALIYFQKRGSRLRPYLSLGGRRCPDPQPLFRRRHCFGQSGSTSGILTSCIDCPAHVCWPGRSPGRFLVFSLQLRRNDCAEYFRRSAFSPGTPSRQKLSKSLWHLFQALKSRLSFLSESHVGTVAPIDWRSFEMLGQDPRVAEAAAIKGLGRFPLGHPLPEVLKDAQRVAGTSRFRERA